MFQFKGCKIELESDGVWGRRRKKACWEKIKRDSAIRTSLPAQYVSVAWNVFALVFVLCCLVISSGSGMQTDTKLQQPPLFRPLTYIPVVMQTDSRQPGRFKGLFIVPVSRLSGPRLFLSCSCGGVD